jgi:hypothetical protein
MSLCNSSCKKNRLTRLMLDEYYLLRGLGSYFLYGCRLGVCRLMVVTLYHCVIVYEKRIGLQDQYWIGINCWKACSRISARVGDTCCAG